MIFFTKLQGKASNCAMCPNTYGHWLYFKSLETKDEQKRRGKIYTQCTSIKKVENKISSVSLHHNQNLRKEIYNKSLFVNLYKFMEKNFIAVMNVKTFQIKKDHGYLFNRIYNH